MNTVDSIRASTFKLSRRRAASVHETSLRIVTDISTDKPSVSSSDINLDFMEFSTAALSNGQVTNTSAFANECITEVGDEVGELMGLLVGIGVGAGVMG